jgi:hypothetical protein
MTELVSNTVPGIISTFLRENDAQLRLEDLFGLCVSFVWWTIVYKVSKSIVSCPKNLADIAKTDQKKYKFELIDYNLHKVSFVHSSMALAGCIYYFYLHGLENVGQPFNTFEKYLIWSSMGYFIFDTIATVTLQVGEAMYMFHHVFVILGIGLALICRQWGCVTVIGIWVGEISGPNLAARRLLKWHPSYAVRTFNDVMFCG